MAAALLFYGYEMKNLIINVVWFPIDLFLLSFHYCKGFLWLLRYYVRKKFGAKQSSWPFGCFTVRIGSGRCACIPGSKYKNIFLFRALCPDIALDGSNPPQTYCRAKMAARPKFWRPPAIRLLGVGLLLATVWSFSGVKFFNAFVPKESRLLAKAEKFYDKGMVLYNAGEYDPAFIAFQNAIKFDPEIGKYHFQIGMCLFSKQEFNKSLSALEKSVELKPEMWEWRLELAKLAYSFGMPNKAVPHLLKVIELQPLLAEGHCLLSLCYCQQKSSLSLAKTAVEEALKCPNTSASDYELAAHVYSNLGDLSESENCYIKAIELNPNSIDGRIGLAYTLKEQARLEEAENEINSILLIDASHIQAMTCRAEIYISKGELQEAVNQYSRVVTTSPQNAQAMTRLAFLYTRTNKIEKSLELLKSAISSNPNYTDARILLAETLFNQRRYTDAIYQSNQILKVDDKHGKTITIKAKSLLATQDYGESDKLNWKVSRFPS